MTQGKARIGLVALGANLPSGGKSPEISVVQAMDRLEEVCGAQAKRSRLFATPAFPAGSGPEFVNAAMRLPWDGAARDLLELLHEIEADFGRTRAQRWEARVMDLDLIGLGDAILPDPQTRNAWAQLTPEEAAQAIPDQLILPHPRLAERAFVIVPLADVAPDWVDPATDLSVAEMFDALDPAERDKIQPLD